jgi:hypothetical protein
MKHLGREAVVAPPGHLVVPYLGEGPDELDVGGESRPRTGQVLIHVHVPHVEDVLRLDVRLPAGETNRTETQRCA